MGKKKRNSEDFIDLMARGNREFAIEDLKIAEDFSHLEDELIEECSA